MSRQDFAPKQSEIRITDLTKGLGEFRPKTQRPISLPALETALKKAGYKLEQASVAARGAVEHDGAVLYLRIPETGQRFELRGFENLKEGSTVTLEGLWSSRAAAAGTPGGQPANAAFDVLTAKAAR